MRIEYSPGFEKSVRKMIWQERLAPINPAEWKRRITWFVQRGRRGYSDQDLWGAYHHVATTIKAYCQKYKDPEARMGTPMGLTPRKWTHILTEVEWLMDEVMGYSTPIEVIVTTRYKNRRKKAEAYFAEYWQAMWD